MTDEICIGTMWENIFIDDIVDAETTLVCNGRSLNPKEYPALFDVIGYKYGNDNDFFKLPNMPTNDNGVYKTAWVVKYR